MVLRDYPHKIASQPFELEQYNEEVYELSFKGTEHHNFYCFDNDLKSVIMSLKQEFLNEKEYFRWVLADLGFMPEIRLFKKNTPVYENFLT